jgi:hypothetical protein
MRSSRILTTCIAGLVSASCGRSSPGPEVHTDLAELERILRVPKGVTSVRWLVLGPISTSRLPGPGDLPRTGLAYLETRPNFWADEGYRFAPADTVSRKFEGKHAEALFPESLRNSGSLSGGWLELRCVRLAPEVFAPSPRMAEALRCGSGLVLSFRAP